MLDSHLKKYLLDTLPAQEAWVDQLEAHAKRERVPIMDPVSMHFVMQLIRMSQPARILEIGTAIGYSALRMLEAKPDAKIVTIERDQERYLEALRHIEERGKGAAIQVILGDAKDVLLQLQAQGEAFDFIFIDAAKSQYENFFKLSEPLLTDRGMIVSDNVLFRGYVAGIGEPLDRHKKMIDKLKAFNTWLMNRTDFVTSIVPIGDGIAISLKQIKNDTKES